MLIDFLSPYDPLAVYLRTQRRRRLSTLAALSVAALLLPALDCYAPRTDPLGWLFWLNASALALGLWQMFSVLDRVLAVGARAETLLSILPAEEIVDGTVWHVGLDLWKNLVAVGLLGFGASLTLDPAGPIYDLARCELYWLALISLTWPVCSFIAAHDCLSRKRSRGIWVWLALPSLLLCVWRPPMGSALVCCAALSLWTMPMRLRAVAMARRRIESPVSLPPRRPSRWLKKPSNPVLRRELSRGFGGPLSRLWTAVVPFLPWFIGAELCSGEYPSETLRSLAAVGLALYPALLWALAAWMALRTVARERRARSLVGLWGTRLSQQELLAAWLGAVWIRLRWWLVSGCVTLRCRTIS